MSSITRRPLLAFTLSLLIAVQNNNATQCCGFQFRPIFQSRRSMPMQLFSSTASSSTPSNPDDDQCTKIYFDIAIPTPSEEISLGRLTFLLTPSDHPNHLPLHISNLISLAEGKRKSIDSKSTYQGCSFQYSPATIEDGSFRYRWGHVCEGYGRNGIQTMDASISGKETSFDEPFSDPQRIKECAIHCFGGTYYGHSYQEIVNILRNDANSNDGQQRDDDDDDAVILLTVPIHGPGSGTSKFSIVRVSESPQEWGERLLLNSAVVGYLDCSAMLE